MLYKNERMTSALQGIFELFLQTENARTLVWGNLAEKAGTLVSFCHTFGGMN